MSAAFRVFPVIRGAALLARVLVFLFFFGAAVLPITASLNGLRRGLGGRVLFCHGYLNRSMHGFRSCLRSRPRNHHGRYHGRRHLYRCRRGGRHMRRRQAFAIRSGRRSKYKRFDIIFFLDHFFLTSRSTPFVAGSFHLHASEAHPLLIVTSSAVSLSFPPWNLSAFRAR